MKANPGDSPPPSTSIPSSWYWLPLALAVLLALPWVKDRFVAVYAAAWAGVWVFSSSCRWPARSFE